MKNKASKDSKEISTLSISKILTLLIGIITSAILSRARTLEEYGTYSQMVTAATIATSVLMLGLPNSINFYLSRHSDERERNRYISVFYTLNTLLSALAGLILVLTVPFLSAYFNNPLIKSFAYFLAVYPWTRIITATVERLLIQYGKSKYVLVYNLCHSCAILAVNAAVAIGAMEFGIYLLLYTIVQVVFSIVVYFIAGRFGNGLHFIIDKALIREILVFSVPLGLASVIGTLNIELDKLVIGRLMDPASVALYANAGKEMPVTFLTASINAVMLPRITQFIRNKETKKAINTWGEATYVSFAFLCICSFGFIVFAPQILTLLYSEKYLIATGIFRVYCVELLLRCTYIGMILNACGDTKKILYCSIGSLVLNLALNVLFYYIFGFIGPAISTVLSAVVMNCMQLVMTAKKTEISFSELMPWKRMFGIIILNSLLGLLFYALQNIIPLEMVIGEAAEAIIMGAIWFGVYCLIIGKKLLSVWKRLGE